MAIDINKITLENLSEYENSLIKRCIICGKEFKITHKKAKEVCSSRCSSIRTHRIRKEKSKQLLGE